MKKEESREEGEREEEEGETAGGARPCCFDPSGCAL